MSAYVLVRYDVQDADAFARYRELAGPTHGRFGGTLVAKGSRIAALEGDDDLPNVVLLQFPDDGAAREWYSSAEYQSAKAARDGAGEMVLTLLHA